ncbi:MAG: uroporphyrinogen-III C-methyltransferase [Tissierellia bacterium]|nr:uroporphyrinogen-III C-methyltransferase [Tissierellia bacterium]
MSAKVYLIGAGPGDPDLITIRGMEVLKKADIILYDNLLSEDLLKENDRAKKIYCGKRAGKHSSSQTEINRLLKELSENYDTVVRLKGGDPYIFGRGGEEALFLAENKIEFEVIPGITSSIAGFANVGIPLTYRDIATSLHFITASRASDKDIDFSKYANLDGSLVFYMGVRNINNIAKGLIRGGMDEKSKMMVLHNATYPDQESSILTLSQAAVSKKGDFKTPSLILVGKVIDLSEKLDKRNMPLSNKRIVVTRSKTQSKKLVESLRALGAYIINIPTIKTMPLSDNTLIEDLNRYKDGIIAFSSANGVKYFMEIIFKESDIRIISNYKIAAIGQSTANELANYGIKADIIPEISTSEGFSKAILENTERNENLLIIRPEKSRGIIKKICDDKLNCKELIIYKTEAEDIDLNSFNLLMKGFDFITFTSSSTVKSFMENLCKSKLSENEKNDLLNQIRIKSVSIGPITTSTLLKYNIIPIIESSEISIESMVDMMQGVNYVI